MRQILLLPALVGLATALPSPVKCGTIANIDIYADNSCQSITTFPFDLPPQSFDPGVCDCQFFSTGSCSGSELTFTDITAVVLNQAKSYSCSLNADANIGDEEPVVMEDPVLENDNMTWYYTSDNSTYFEEWLNNTTELGGDVPEKDGLGKILTCTSPDLALPCAFQSYWETCKSFPYPYYHNTNSFIQLEGHGSVVNCFYFRDAGCKGGYVINGLVSQYERMQGKNMKGVSIGSAGCQAGLGPAGPNIVSRE